MKNKMIKLILSTAVLGILLSACASIPEPLQGEYTTTEPQLASSLSQNQQIRWGGIIIAVNPEAASTCLEILGKPLNKQQRPLNQDGTIGRFIVCKNQFIDPEVIAEGREVTITGAIRHIEEREIGEYIYSYPIIDAGSIYLWPEREERVYYNTGGMYYWPYYSPYHYYPYMYTRPARPRG